MEKEIKLKNIEKIDLVYKYIDICLKSAVALA